MASLVQVGVASRVIYQLYTLQYNFYHGPHNFPALPENKSLFGGIVDQFVSGITDQKGSRQLGIPDSISEWITKTKNTLVSNVDKIVQIRVCYGSTSDGKTVQ